MHRRIHVQMRPDKGKHALTHTRADEACLQLSPCTWGSSATISSATAKACQKGRSRLIPVHEEDLEAAYGSLQVHGEGDLRPQPPTPRA